MRRFTTSAALAVAAVALTAGCSFSFSAGEPSSPSSSPSGSSSKSTEKSPASPKQAPPSETPAKTVPDGAVVTVDKDELAQRVSELLTQQVGRAPELVTCPEDLTGEVGAQTRCELEDSGDRYGVEVTVTEVDGTNVGFNLKVDEQPS